MAALPYHPLTPLLPFLPPLPIAGYVTVVLAWGFLTHDITSPSSGPPSLLDTKDNEGSTIYLGWIALFVVGIFLIYIASIGLHSARKVRRPFFSPPSLPPSLPHSLSFSLLCTMLLPRLERVTVVILTAPSSLPFLPSLRPSLRPFYLLQVSIHHLLRYFWGAALGIAPLVLVTACAFDFYDISRSKKGWREEGREGTRGMLVYLLTRFSFP